MNILVQVPDELAVAIDGIADRNKSWKPVAGLATPAEKSEALRIAHKQGTAAANVYLRNVARNHQKDKPPTSRAAVARMLLQLGLNCYLIENRPAKKVKRKTNHSAAAPPAVAPAAEEPSGAARQ